MPKSVINEHTLLGKVVVRMLSRQEYWLAGASEPGLRLYSHVLSVCHNPYNSEELERLLASSPDEFTTKNRFVLLEPTDEDILPILTFSYNFTAKVPIVSLEVGMFHISGKKLDARGIRFETPHRGSKHNYYHAQPLDALRNGGFKLPSPPLLSAKCPSFALNALNVGTLLFCVIVSLYGREKLDDLQADLRAEGLGPQLRRFTQDLHWSDPNLKRGNRFEYDHVRRWRQAPKG
jgi:hypothetical protein